MLVWSAKNVTSNPARILAPYFGKVKLIFSRICIKFSYIIKWPQGNRWNASLGLTSENLHHKKSGLRAAFYSGLFSPYFSTFLSILKEMTYSVHTVISTSRSRITSASKPCMTAIKSRSVTIIAIIYVSNILNFILQ